MGLKPFILLVKLLLQLCPFLLKRLLLLSYEPILQVNRLLIEILGMLVPELAQLDRVAVLQLALVFLSFLKDTLNSRLELEHNALTNGSDLLCLPALLTHFLTCKPSFLLLFELALVLFSLLPFDLFECCLSILSRPCRLRQLFG